MRRVTAFLFAVASYGLCVYIALRTWPAIVPFVVDLFRQTLDATETAWRDLRERA